MPPSPPTLGPHINIRNSLASISACKQPRRLLPVQRRAQPERRCRSSIERDAAGESLRQVRFDSLPSTNVNRFARELDRRILTNCLISDPPKDGLTHSLPLVSASRFNPSMSLTSLWLHS